MRQQNEDGVGGGRKVRKASWLSRELWAPTGLQEASRGAGPQRGHLRGSYTLGRLYGPRCRRKSHSHGACRSVTLWYL